MAIRIERNEAGNCINFHGASNPTYWNACLSGEVDSNFPDTVNVINDIITAQTGVTEYEYFRVPFTEFTDADGNAFADAQVCADYITQKANVVGLSGEGIDLTGETVCFSLDATSTSIMLDTGHAFGVNTIKAIPHSDGTVHIVSNDGADDITHFHHLDAANTCVNGSAVSGGLNDVVNTLNELFTVGAFASIVIADPYSTMVADVNGIDAGYTLEGADAIDPIGDDIFTYDGVGYANYAGLKSVATIDQAGEYYTFDIRGEGTIGFGLVHTQASFDAGLYSGNVNYANPANYAAVNSAHYGFQFSHWFHPTPNGSWTNYGANTTYSMRAGWSNFNGTDEQADWLAGNPIKVRCGIDENGYISIETLRGGSTWVVHARSGYPVPQGSSYHLGIKSQSTSARVFSAPKVHLLEPEAPTMYFRYIESPDGVFHYPLFATAEEAEYYDEIHNGLTAGTGSSHTHTYNDDPTNTTWYMPEASHDPTSYTYSVAPSGTETFNGNAVTYTEVTSLTNSSFVPSTFGASNITQEEGTNVNIQVTPAGASWTSSVTITPSGSGLVYDGYSLVQGTLSDVGSDTTYTITVTRANSYGSSVGSMTVTATDVAPVQTNDTAWTKALDFSGSSEHAKQVGTNSNYMPIAMDGLSATAAAPTVSGNTSGDFYSRPFATVVVFKADGNNSNQHIWNQGDGANSGDDNIYLKLDAQNQLQFNWGRVNAGSLNQMRVASGIQSNTWYGVYIAHDGTRLSSSNASAANLADAFDIRLMSSGDSFASLGSNLSTSSNWTSTGGRMDRSVAGSFTIGGRGSNRSFHGKVASFVATTLRINQPMPTEAEAELMITDPVKWLSDYKDGNSFRVAYGQNEQTFINGATYQSNSVLATQVWLMGDGTNDSYSNMIRNQVMSLDQNYTKLPVSYTHLTLPTN